MGAFSERAARWVDAVADWLGFKVRKVLTTNPPPMDHKPAPLPRLNPNWQRGVFTQVPKSVLPRIPRPIGDDEKTPTDPPGDGTNPGFKMRHARPRPPRHDKGKPS